MDHEKYSVDDILLEVGLSPSSEKDRVDVDALLQTMTAPEQSEPPEKVEETALFTEPPTREFVPARKPQPTVPVPQPVDNPPISEDSGSFSIDVDGIRQEEQATASDSERPPIHFHQKKEDDGEQQLEFAPGFRKLGTLAQEESVTNWESILLKEKNSAVVRGIFLLIMAAASLAFSMMIHLNAAADTGFVPSMSLLLTTGAVGIIAGILGFPVLQSGCGSLRKLEPNRDLLPTAAYLFCMLQWLTQLVFPKGLSNPNIHQYLPVGILLLSLSFFGRTVTLRTTVKNWRTLQMSRETYEPQIIWDGRAAAELCKGLVEDEPCPTVNRKTEQIADFLKLSLSMDSSDRFGRLLSVAGTALAVLVALFVFLFTRRSHLAVTIMTAIVCIFASAVDFYAVSYPLWRCAKKASSLHSLVSGEKSGENYGNVNAMVVNAKSLFPSTSVILNGIKTFEGMRIDEAILDAASVLSAADSILTDVFVKMIGSRTEMLRKAENLHYEDGMGLSAWIDNRRILIGNRELMASHNIRVPSIDYERRFTAEGSDLVYLSASGELTAVFIFTLRPTIATEDAIQMLYSNDIALSVRTMDALITKERLSQLFVVEPNFFKIIPTKLDKLCEECSQPVKIRPAISVNDGSFASMACSVSAAKRLRIMTTVARVVMLTSIGLGFLLVAVFGFLGATRQLSPMILCCYSLIWLMIHFLLQKVIRIS